MEDNINQVLPLERFGGNQVSAEDKKKLEDWLKQCFAAGWSDFEIVYDIARNNGRTISETGRFYGPLELIAVIRGLLGAGLYIQAGTPGESDTGPTGPNRDPA